METGNVIKVLPVGARRRNKSSRPVFGQAGLGRKMLPSSMINFLNQMGIAIQTEKESTVLSAEAFRAVFERERARTDRDGKPFSIIIFKVPSTRVAKDGLEQFVSSLSLKIRITDVLGWTEKGNVALLLYHTDSQGAFIVAEKIQNLKIHSFILSYEVFQYPETPKSVSNASAGGAPASDIKAEDPDSSKQEADHAPQEISSVPTEPSPAQGYRIPDSVLSGIPWWKRSLDIVGASVGLLGLSPLFLTIAAGIKFFSPGPVFFMQERIGYGGSRFMCWKFRTMVPNADPGTHKEYLRELITSSSLENGEAMPMKKIEKDPRIIPVIGRALRASCLDELPQLINVLKGEMSLIGPRPAIPYEVKDYSQWNYERFDALPGMTGLWQVSGKNRLTFNQMIRLDIDYARHLSFLRDMKILASTPGAIISQIRDQLLNKPSGEIKQVS